LDTQEQDLADLEQSLSIAREQVEFNMNELVKAEERLAATMTRSATAAEDDLSRLTSVYENMKPKDATTLFETMSPDFAAGFIGRMRPDAAAQIMAGLSPGFAYSISAILAGRNAGAPTE
jgi:flagellar motility protein MotE (MotC chaperone)